MASTLVYGRLALSLFNKEIDYEADTIKAALVTSSYTPSQDNHDYWDDVSANEVSGTGYTAGGATLGSKTITYDGASNKTTLDAADVTWAASTLTARYCVIYDDSPATAATKPLIAYIDFGANQSSSAGTFTVSWSAQGVVTMTMA
jgi:hypothetical protein